MTDIGGEQGDAEVWRELRPVPAEMTAVRFHEFGGPDVLRVDRIPVPTPGPGEVLVQVRAVGVGRLLDLVARAGKHPYARFDLPHILGAEHVGLVAAWGDGVAGPPIGSRVAVYPSVNPVEDEHTAAGQPELSPVLKIIGTHRPGAYALYSTVPAVNVFVVPDGVSPTQAVALALSGPVALNQFTAVGLRPGQRVLVQGASSALGSTTALLARELGAEVIATSRSEDKRADLRRLGLGTVLDPHDEDLVAKVRQAFGGAGADVVVDNLGEPTIWAASLAVLAPGGAVVSSGAFLGRQVVVDLQRLYVQGQRIVGVRTGNLRAAAELWQLVAAGFRVDVDRTFPLEEAAAAHRHVESGANVGRVALVVG